MTKYCTLPCIFNSTVLLQELQKFLCCPSCLAQLLLSLLQISSQIFMKLVLKTFHCRTYHKEQIRLSYILFQGQLSKQPFFETLLLHNLAV